MVATWKTDLVDELAQKVKSHKVVGIVGIENVPSKQMSSIRKKISSDVELIVSRKSIIKRALGKAKVKGMDGYVDGIVGLIFTDLNPFQLEKLLFDNRTKAPAKAGAIAPFDLVVPEGDTGLPAGPVIGDLQGAGIKARIQGGTITVTEDSTVVKSGEPVPSKVAPVLARLGIEPIDIMLKLHAAFEDGTVFEHDVLHIDPQETMAKLTGAYQKALNMSFNARVFTKPVMELLLCDAAANARNLMINAEIVNGETIGIFLAKADAHAKALKAVLPEDLAAQVEEKSPEEPKAEAEPKAEEAAEEAKPEAEAKAEVPKAEAKPPEKSD